MSGATGRHTPVMAGEIVDALSPVDGGIYVDGTFGGGGHSRALLAAATCTVWGIDRDERAADLGRHMARCHEGRLTVLLGRFGDMVGMLGAAGVRTVDGITLDLGVSSAQLDDPDRGFSFLHRGPLDMRMGGEGSTAADLVNRLDERELADLIHDYGEERAARRIARAIVETRADGPITTTDQLARLIRRVVRPSRDGIDPATRAFQALRIRVNDELDQLDQGLAAAEILLRPGGRLAVIAFHSLEDRRVKRFLRARGGAAPQPHRHLPLPSETRRAPSFRLLDRGVTRPSAREVAANPRARSARLRSAERTAAPPWRESGNEEVR